MEVHEQYRMVSRLTVKSTQTGEANYRGWLQWNSRHGCRKPLGTSIDRDGEDNMDRQLRYGFIDFLKGVGIFLVVWGHTMTPRSAYIYSFHMPLFFFLSGFVHQNKPLGKFIFAKINALYIPYALFTVLSWLFYLLRYWVYGNYREIFAHLSKLLSLFTGLADNGGNNPIWYLTCIFVVSIFFRMISKIADSKIRFGVIGVFSLIGYWLSRADISLYFNADIACTGLVFYSVGYLVRQRDLLRHLAHLKRWTWSAVVVGAELLHIVSTRLNVKLAEITRVNMAGNLLGDYFLFYSASLLGVFVFLAIGYRIGNWQLVNYFGVNSLLILATHKPLLLLFDTQVGKYLDIPEKLYGLIATVAVLALTVPLIAFINRKAPQAIGKQPLLRWETVTHWLSKGRYLPN